MTMSEPDLDATSIAEKQDWATRAVRVIELHHDRQDRYDLDDYLDLIRVDIPTLLAERRRLKDESVKWHQKFRTALATMGVAIQYLADNEPNRADHILRRMRDEFKSDQQIAELEK